MDAMEVRSGASNWKLTVRREAEGVTLLRAMTCDERAVLPEMLFGLPVTALGPHALSPLARAAEGEAVELTCGLPESGAVWDNRSLTDLTLPATLRRVGDYAFSNCGNLEALRLHDAVDYWGGGVLTNCRSLNRFYLTRTGEQGAAMAYFVAELSRELDVTVYNPDGSVTRLIFPEYEETEEEDFIAQAVQFQYHISGAGYLYHGCFQRKRLNLKDFDNLWPEYLRRDYDEETALRLAWYRLRYPVELTEKAAAGYLGYLKSRAEAAVAWLVGERDVSGLRQLLKQTLPGREALASACALAREQGSSEALAILLEESHRRFPVGGGDRFAL